MIYVDNYRANFGRMKMSHLTADSPEELEEARIALGIPPTGIHNRGLPGEHLDVSESKRNQAVRELGAKEVAPKDMVVMIQRKRERRKEAESRREADRKTGPDRN